ncbi:MAG: hypothetical protein ACOC8O_01355, partial [Natronomonas sp.]
PDPTGTDDSVAEDEPSSVLPGWLPSDEEDFKAYIYGLVATWIVGTILRGTDWVATIILRAWAGLASSFEAAFLALETVYAIPFDIVTQTVTLYGDTAASAASGAGVVAPLVALVFVAIPILVFAAIAQFVLGFLDTYLPLSALPVVGRWFP